MHNSSAPAGEVARVLQLRTLVVACLVLSLSVTAQARDPGAPQPAQVFVPVTLDFEGALASEAGATNPFLDLRLDVLFRHVDTATQLRIPGYFAADGAAGETGAHAGTVWRVRFTPALEGLWTWEANFRSGPGVAVSDDLQDGQPTAFDGASGSLLVGPAPPGAAGFHGSGPVLHDGWTYWRTAGDGRPFIKVGANSPENLLAYVDFDQTSGTHAYLPHLGDWAPGDPAWHGGQDGKALVGALNYLADRGLNAVYMLTFNVGGDGDDVWPWSAKHERLRFDCSKLDQWAQVFDHMDALGLMAHIVLQETEIDNEPGLALDDGELGVERRLYHRELVARFGHKLGLCWNLGEENQNSTGQLLAFAENLRELDAGRHPLVLHTYPGVGATVYAPLLDAEALQGASLQVADPADVHATVLQIRQLGLDAGHPWAVHLDEIGPPNDGVMPDSSDPLHTSVRRHALWGALMGGAAGIEWYFGYDHPDDDLDCEDWRSREEMWRQSAVAATLFDTQLPLADLQPADQIVHGAPGWALSAPGQFHAVYLPTGGQASLKLGGDPSTYLLRWYDPRLGGALQKGSVTQLKGPGVVSLGAPPSAPFQDWVALAAVLNTGPSIGSVDVAPEPFDGPGDLALSITVDDEDGPEDVVQVRVAVVSPEGRWMGQLLPAPVGGPHWQLLLDRLPALAKGLWRLHVEATDSAGHRAVTFADFESF